MKTKHQLTSQLDYVVAISNAVDSNKLDMAAELCFEASLFYKDSFSVNYYLAFLAYRKGDTENTILYINKALKLYKADKATNDEIFNLNNLGVILLEMNKPQEAKCCFEIFLSHMPGDYVGMSNLSKVFMNTNEHKEALQWLKKAETIRLSYDLALNIGVTLFKLKELEAARQYFLKAISFEPRRWRPYHLLGCASQEVGDSEGAVKYFCKSIELSPGDGRAYFGLSEIGSYIKNKENATRLISEINNMLKKVVLEQGAAENLNFALGNIYNAQKQYDLAFKSYELANAGKINSSTFDVEKYGAGLERFSKVFNKNFMAEKKEWGNGSSVPGFIVGMPRSGTTLVEQIITSHSNVYSRGETSDIGLLTEAITVKIAQTPNGLEKFYFPEVAQYYSQMEVHDFSKHYLQIIGEGREGALKVFDKMPENAFNIGFIKLLFPNAVIINCKRHPLDVVMSMFSSNFYETNFPNSLEIIARYYKYYAAIMKHWHEVFPGQIYDNYYEELVHNQQEKSHELLKACGLDWEEACMEFYKNNKPVFTASKLQVKEPIYASSIFRWKNYGVQLAAVLEYLQEEIAEYEAELFKRVPELG